MVKFKYFKTLAVYNNNASTIANDDIVFIEDDNSLVTHGKTYKFVDLEPEYVDLGLPSGTLWAKWNVGATSETEYGNYYGYGKGAAQYAETSGDSNYSGTENPLDSSVDTASQVWGGSWHMPTKAQMQELIANTTYQWVTDYKGSGINGGTFTATNGAVLFLPAAGYCYKDFPTNGVGDYGRVWSSTPSDSDAYFLNFNNSSTRVSDFMRVNGYPVRAVKEKKNYVEGTGTNGYIAKWTDTNSIGNLIALSSSISTQTQSTKFLREDGTWAAPSYTANDGNTQYYLSLNGSTNGTSGTTNLGTIYAPTTAGTSGQYLVSSGSGAPSWGSAPSIATPVVVSSSSAGTAVSVTIDPNKTYSFPLVSSLTITLGSLVDSSNYINEYHFEFNSGSTATTLSLPNTVKGIDAASIEANKHYEVSIKYDPKDTNYYGIIHSWELS